MIIVQIKSGLGNQMFQYATAKALALRNKDTLKLDISECVRTDVPLWKYRLGVLNIDENFAAQEEIDRLKFSHGKLSKFYFKVKTKLGMFNVGYSPMIKRSKGDVYLNGFFQTERYFDDQRGAVRKDFTLKDPIGSHAEEIRGEMRRSSPSVSLHIRRADYASDKATNSIYATFTDQYYFDSLKYIAAKTGKQPHVFFFSDDIEWVKSHIKVPYDASYVSAKDIADHEEIYLMSQCDHNIISNSSFGWWGAWLNQNSDKIVIAPKRWANKRNFVYRDIVPKSWIRI